MTCGLAGLIEGVAISSVAAAITVAASTSSATAAVATAVAVVTAAISPAIAVITVGTLGYIGIALKPVTVVFVVAATQTRCIAG